MINRSWGQLASVSHERLMRGVIISSDVRRINWPLRREKLSKLTTFMIQGYLEVRAHRHKGAHLAFRWEQSPSIYRKNLFNRSAESLLHNHLGVNIPLSYFTDWFKGMPKINT